MTPVSADWKIINGGTIVCLCVSVCVNVCVNICVCVSERDRYFHEVEVVLSETVESDLLETEFDSVFINLCPRQSLT